MSNRESVRRLAAVVGFVMLVATLFLAPFASSPVNADGGNGGQPADPPCDTCEVPVAPSDSPSSVTDVSDFQILLWTMPVLPY